MKFAKIVFWAAAAWGALSVTPLFFALAQFNRDQPPPVTHAEFYYGFLAVVAVWQIVYFMIGAMPERLRPIMIPAALAKAGWVVTVACLSAAHSLPKGIVVFSAIDAVFAILFAGAFLTTRDITRGQHHRPA